MSVQEQQMTAGYWPQTRQSLIIELQEVGEDDPRREHCWGSF